PAGSARVVTREPLGLRLRVGVGTDGTWGGGVPEPGVNGVGPAGALVPPPPPPLQPCTSAPATRSASARDVNLPRRMRPPFLGVSTAGSGGRISLRSFAMSRRADLAATLALALLALALRLPALEAAGEFKSDEAFEYLSARRIAREGERPAVGLPTTD